MKSPINLADYFAAMETKKHQKRKNIALYFFFLLLLLLSFMPNVTNVHFRIRVPAFHSGSFSRVSSVIPYGEKYFPFYSELPLSLVSEY